MILKFLVYCNSQRDGLHAVQLPRIDDLMGQGLDLAIQTDLQLCIAWESQR